MSDDFRALLRRYRDRRRWSQERCALECEMDHSLVSRLESGQRTPTRDSLAKLCAGLGLLPAETDALLLAAGYRPHCPESVIADEPAVADLYRLLKDERLAAGARASLRQALTALASTVDDLRVSRW
jgi:transcriptional regulator with XRE-family HTH domain